MKEQLKQIIAVYTDDRFYLLELLYFWVRHPFTQLDQLAVTRLLEDREQHLKIALNYLLDKQVVRSSNRNNVVLFSLTDIEPVRSQVLDLFREKRPPAPSHLPQGVVYD